MRTILATIVTLILSMACFAADDPIDGKVYFRLPAGSQPLWDIYEVRDFAKEVRGEGSFLFITHYIDGRDTPVTDIFPVHATIAVFFVPNKARHDETLMRRARRLGVPIR